MYHIWKYNKRGIGLFIISRRDHWKYGTFLARWATRQAAWQWGQDNHDQVPHGYKVLQCEGPGCGIAECRQDYARWEHNINEHEFPTIERVYDLGTY